MPHGRARHSVRSLHTRPAASIVGMTTVLRAMAIVTRFAPSPTGLLHLGHAYSALFAARQAEERGRRFLLRIEDIDRARCRPEFEAAIYEDLTWLGLEWPRPVRRQSEHLDDYRAALARLDALGVIYPCFCTRAEIAAESASAPHVSGGIAYPGTCRRLDATARSARLARGDAHSLRLDAAKAARLAGALQFHERDRGRQGVDPMLNGDVILARKEMPTSYHLAVTVDDHLQGVTLVTRGEDLFQSTHVHRLLQALLGYDPPEYRHHRLLTDASGGRYAKRDRSVTVRALRDAGKTPAEVRALAGHGA